MLHRSFDAAHLNMVLNHPDVAKWMIGIEPPYDLSPIVEDKNNIFLSTETGGFLFVKKRPGKYEVHTQFLPEGRGNSLRLAKEAAWYMFTNTDCTQIETYVPAENKAAWRLTVAMSFKPKSKKRVNRHECTLFVLDIKSWAVSLCQQQH